MPSAYKFAQRMSKLSGNESYFNGLKQWMLRLSHGGLGRTDIHKLWLLAGSVSFDEIMDKEISFDFNVDLRNEHFGVEVIYFLFKLHAVIVPGASPKLKYLNSDFIPAIFTRKYDLDPLDLDILDLYDVSIDFAEILGEKFEHDAHRSRDLVDRIYGLLSNNKFYSRYNVGYVMDAIKHKIGRGYLSNLEESLSRDMEKIENIFIAWTGVIGDPKVIVGKRCYVSQIS